VYNLYTVILQAQTVLSVNLLLSEIGQVFKVRRRIAYRVANNRHIPINRFLLNELTLDVVPLVHPDRSGRLLVPDVAVSPTVIKCSYRRLIYRRK